MGLQKMTLAKLKKYMFTEKPERYKVNTTRIRIKIS